MKNIYNAFRRKKKKSKEKHLASLISDTMEPEDNLTFLK